MTLPPSHLPAFFYKTMMHLAMQYAGADGTDAADSLKLLQRLLKAPGGDASVKAVDREKRTPLHWAAGKNALPCVNALLAAGADVHARDWAEHTPLHWACPMDALESVKAPSYKDESYHESVKDYQYYQGNEDWIKH